MSDRPDSPARRGRSLTFIAAAGLLAAVALTVFGLTANRNDGGVVLDVQNAVADPPPTVAPFPSAPRSAPQDSVLPENQAPQVESPDAESPDAGVLLSPLAEQLGPRYSAIPDDIAPRPRPTGMQISSVDVSNVPIRAVGLEDDGQLEIPDETEIGWYRYGATAGRPGATVLAAHVSWNGTTGPFARLGTVDPSDQIEVTLDDGTVRRYVVTERAIYGKLELPRDRIWRTTGDESLVLITCGGDFNPEIRRYQQNIVVYAVPVG